MANISVARHTSAGEPRKLFIQQVPQRPQFQVQVFRFQPESRRQLVDFGFQPHLCGLQQALAHFQIAVAGIERLAAALRNENMKPQPFDAFVLHHRMGSIVTVGEFDAPDDPKLLETQRILLGMSFKMLDKNGKPVIGKDGQPDQQRMFDSVSPFPVPKFDPISPLQMRSAGVMGR